VEYMTKELRRTDILNRLTNEYPIIKKKFGIKRMGLFGSYARDEGRFDSDIDILVSFEEGKERFRVFFSCITYLEDILGKKVEMISEHAIDPRIKQFIERDIIWI